MAKKKDKESGAGPQTTGKDKDKKNPQTDKPPANVIGPPGNGDVIGPPGDG
jgi:hypothetical protein